MATAEAPPEVFAWLKSMPVAPEYHPTLAEFQDPISYIFKIEKEASKYGICKIVPPVPASSKKTAIANLNRSLAAKNPNSSPTFTTRQQQVGFCPRRHQPVHKSVWQSGENYTLGEFEAKAKNFEKGYLKRKDKRPLTALEIETLYWKATVDKPVSVEYANDMPGSAFVPVNVKKLREAGEAVTVGETAWNMRGVSRANGSLLRFMKEEIPGVTSPMVYVAMLFSWFAWHVEDHDLHSLNYLHMGSGKTWYGVPRDAAVAFEEVVRVNGYGEEINPLVTFAILGEKTTVMSPEEFISAGIPCCRLVQNAGEFVVTFPRAYHSGFSHGFNCGEAANIATPEWLRVAKEAAIRRASINCPPMVSHSQLLYDLALALCSRVPMSISAEPRSSRLKDKKKGEGETLVKELFVQNIIHNNDLLHLLANGSPCVLLPNNFTDASVKYSDLSQSKIKPKVTFGLCNLKEAKRTSSSSNCMLERTNKEVKKLKDFYSVKGKVTSLSERDRTWSSFHGDEGDHDGKRENCTHSDGLGMFSCVTCGILSFDCVAVIQPTDAASQYLMAADCSFFNDWAVGSDVNTPALKSSSGMVAKSEHEGLYDVPIQSADYQIQIEDQDLQVVSYAATPKETSALGLLALTYGNSSDSEEDQEPGSEFEHDTSAIAYAGSGDESPFQKDRKKETVECSVEFDDTPVPMESNCGQDKFGNLMTKSHSVDMAKFSNALVPIESTSISFVPKSNEDSSRTHVFCLEHAVEVEQQLRSIGGVHILLLCHRDYPKVESEAKRLAEELGIDYVWSEIAYRDATKEEQDTIQSAVESEDAKPGNGDWAVKLGINLYYTADLSRASLYSKQMPYNSVIYNVFGRNTSSTSPTNTKQLGRQKKIVVAGKWCGKVWMSNQVHPFLAQRDSEEQEQDRSIFRSCGNPDRSLERKSESEKPVSPAKQSLRKRKSTAENRPVEKVNDASSGFAVFSEDSSCRREKRVLRSKQSKRRHLDSNVDDADLEGGPSTRLRKRITRPSSKESLSKRVTTDTKQASSKKKAKGIPSRYKDTKTKVVEEAEEYLCDIEGCTMSFGSKQELVLHKRNICPIKGCGKKFFSHKYLVQHRRVHMDDRPLKCPWKGCKMTFKWAWARTEHIRVHTGERPYVCSEPGCGQTFRFVSDFSRHKRKTGHSTKKKGVKERAM